MRKKKEGREVLEEEEKSPLFNRLTVYSFQTLSTQSSALCLGDRCLFLDFIDHHLPVWTHERFTCYLQTSVDNDMHSMISVEKLYLGFVCWL